MLVPAIGAVGHDYDPEYARIIKELMKLGITPSGNKYIDKSRLQTALEEQEEQFLLAKINAKPDNSDKERSELEELRNGAMTIAELNRLFHGI